MKLNKIVLAIDWSNCLFRSLFINRLYGSGATYDRIEDCRSFTFKFASDICSIINIFKPTNVVLLTDSQHAWRKDVLPGENGYKANREKDPNINWDNIFKCSDDLKHIFEKAGCHIAEIDHGEADDLAALCKETIWENFPDFNLIIVSADADLRQLIDFNKVTNQYCAVYNTTTKQKTGKRYFYVNDDMLSWYNKVDNAMDIFFSDVDVQKQYIKDILQQNAKIEMTEEKPNDILIHKILCGDDGDNVPAFYNWYHNGKEVRITPAKARKIKDAFKIKTVEDLISVKKDLKPVFESICKKEINDVNIEERLERQRTLVELNSALFPKDIAQYKDNITYMIKDCPTQGWWNFKAQDILKGTEYEAADIKKALNADVFKDMAKYGLTDKLF